jgi:hypothetical protein
MTDEAMSPLRRRMIEDMTVRKFVEKTQKDYIRHVKPRPIAGEGHDRGSGSLSVHRHRRPGGIKTPLTVERGLHARKCCQAGDHRSGRRRGSGRWRRGLRRRWR